MKILVAISNVPDTTTKIQFTDGDTKFNNAGVTFVINPYDEWYALVRALELKEANLAEKVTLIHVGLADSEATIRKGFALGADDAHSRPGGTSRGLREDGYVGRGVARRG